MNTYDAPGKGRKECPSCFLYVGVRTAICECGHQFNASKARERVIDNSPTNVNESPQRQYGMNTVGTPAGSPPFSLNKFDSESIQEWAAKTKRHFADNNLDLLDEGLIYFGRRMFDFHSEEFKTIQTVILNG